MKDKRKEVYSQLLMVVAPLLVLVMLTAAWFISSRTVGLSELSFAAQGSGAGLGLYLPEALGERIYNETTLRYTSITWDKTKQVSAPITVENMVPGQCEFYLLESGSPFTPALKNVEMKLPEGAESPTLADCVAIYLLPADGEITLNLTRTGDNHLDAAIFRDGRLLQLPQKSNTYILAVFCDPVYGQNRESSKTTHTSTLPGSLSFSLGVG